ncbi:MAG: RdgB/HAM1 family non-canonical purine NTP pyrophosphatase [Microscillaceae bacterium]|nr:RdgB/HAM1 family non-canonical purine NTP pyrophosphatase [Microscillaceae bacterium]
MLKLCFATSNQNKLKEVRAGLASGFELISLDDLNFYEEIPETSGTIEGNSLQKAQFIWDRFQVNCFADDSGLEVDALDGAPGVDSAFYSGSRDFDANIAFLLNNLKDENNRQAQFKAVFTLVLEGNVQQFTGIIRGQILEQKRGEQGFGYDPVFVPDGYSHTFAEMTLDEKNKISHRAQALRQLIDFLNNYPKI